VGTMLLLVRWRLWSCLKPVVGIEGGKVRVVVERDFGIELTKQESIIKVKVSPTDGSVVFAKGIASSLVSTSGASITSASIAGASITGASITRASNLARKSSNSSSSLVDSRRYSSFSCLLSSFRWYYPSRLKSLAIK
jgi:hypothetical protein